jgi:predicted transcriptional regulator
MSFPNYTTAIAAKYIAEGQYARVETRDGMTFAYPVDSHHDRMNLPVAKESATRGELVMLSSQ